MIILYTYNVFLPAKVILSSSFGVFEPVKKSINECDIINYNLKVLIDVTDIRLFGLRTSFLRLDFSRTHHHFPIEYVQMTSKATNEILH